MGATFLSHIFLQIALPLLLITATTLRLIFLSASNFIVDSDEAIVGLMAKHMAEGGAIPTFYYGQPYMGSLEPILISFLFRLFGPSSIALKAVPFLFSLWLVWLVYRLALRFTPPRTAIIAASLCAFPPLALMEWSLKARGGFIELVALGTLALIWSVDLLRANSLPKGKSLLLGLILGLAWWTNNQAIFFLFAVGTVLGLRVLRDFPLRTAFSFAAIVFAGFAAGSWPFWQFNFFAEPRFQTFTMLGGSATWREAAEHLRNCFAEALPIIFGARRFWTGTDLFPGSTALAFFAFGSCFTLMLVTRPRGWQLLAVFTAGTLFIFSLSSFGWLTQAPRYLLPLYPVLFVVAALGIETLLSSRTAASKLLVTALGAIFAVLSWTSNYSGGIAVPGEPFVYAGVRVPRDTAPLYRWLEAEGYDYIRTSYWLGYRVAFETEEKVRFRLTGEPRTVRIRDYQDEGTEHPEAPFVLVKTEAEELGTLLGRLGYTFRLTAAGELFVIDRVVPRYELGAEIPLASAAVKATSRQEWGKRLTDANPGTRWGSGAPRSPGMSLRVELAQPEDVSGVKLSSGLWPQDSSAAISITGIREDGSRCVLYEGEEMPRWSEESGDLAVRFSPIRLTGFEIVQQGTHPVFDWSVAEISAFRPAAH